MTATATGRHAAGAASTGSSRLAGRDRTGGPLDIGWAGVGAAMVAGLVLRLIWVAYAARRPEGIFVDPARYLLYANQIADGNGYTESLTGDPTAYYPPGYPYFLGAVVWVGQHTPLTDDPARLGGYVQAVLGALTAGAAGVVARRLFSPAGGVVAAAAVALWPNLIFHTGALLSETLYNALFVSALAALCWRPWSGGLSTRRLLAFAALFTAAVMVRPISLAVVPVLAAVWWWQDGSWRTALRRTGITVAVVLVAVVPWTVRNAIALDAFVPMSTNTGDNLCIGHYPEATGAFAAFGEEGNRFCDTGDGVQFGAESEVRNDRVKRERAFDYIRGHLGREPWLVWRRAFYLFEHDHDGVIAVQSYRFDPWMDPDTEETYIALSDWYYAVAAVLGAAGLVVAVWFRRPDRMLLVGSAVATVAVPLLFFGDARFKVPVLPLLAIAIGALVALPALRRAPPPP